MTRTHCESFREMDHVAPFIFARRCSWSATRLRIAFQTLETFAKREQRGRNWRVVARSWCASLAQKEHGQTNGAKKKNRAHRCSERTQRRAAQSRSNIRATRSSHPAQPGGSDVWDLCASDRASVHQP